MIGVFLPFPWYKLMHYDFDPALDAPATRKERWVWMVFLGILFFLLYGAANQYAHLTAPHPSWFMAWEQQIPFIPWFIVPYMSSDILFCIAFLLPQTRGELRLLAARVTLIILISVAIFMLLPLQFAFQKPDTSAFSGLFGLLQADLPYNQLPSLHISFAIVLWASMRKQLRSVVVKYAVAIWFWLIAVSTLVVYQHHFVDIPGGVAMGLLAVYSVRPQRPQWLMSGFMTPRHLKMAGYFLLGAVLCLLLVFQFPSLVWVLLWPMVSLLAVSFVYAFGLNHVLAGNNAQASVWQWLLFAPYFIGTYLSWHYYRRKLPLMIHVQDAIYVGRHPTGNEYAALRSQGIGYVLNLAPEHQINQGKLSQTRLAFLDMTIPAPELLQRAVDAMEAHKSQGVYVHCALGLSRSVLVISAWLLSQGYTLAQVNARMREVQPKSVQSPYMQIALECYDKYLKMNGGNIINA